MRNTNFSSIDFASPSPPVRFFIFYGHRPEKSYKILNRIGGGYE